METELRLQQKPGRVMSVEFWRFLFTVLVSVYHFEIFFYSQKRIFPSGSSAVEFFFILAGFTMAMSAKHKMEGRETAFSPKEARDCALDYVKKKLRAIYPVLAVSLILAFVIFPLFMRQNAYTQSGIIQSLMNSEWEWLMLVGTPFGFNYGYAPLVPLWFLTALIIVGYAYTYALHRHYHFVRFLAPVIGILGYIFFALNSSMMIDHAIQMGFLNAGTLHAVAEMALGISVFQLYEYLSKKDFSRFQKILLSLLELYSIYRFFALTLYQPVGFDNFRRIVYLMLIVLLSFLNITWVAKAFDKPFSRWLGSISLAMYLCHYQLIQVYFGLMAWVKDRLARSQGTSITAAQWLKFLQNAGGSGSSYRGSPMTATDVFFYVLLVIAVSLIMLLLIVIVRHLYPVIRRQLYGRRFPAIGSLRNKDK